MSAPTAKSPQANDSNNKPTQRTSGVCKICGAGFPRGVERCIICGTPRGSSEPLFPIQPQPAELPPVEPPLHFRRTRKITAWVASLLVVVLLVSSAGVGVFEYVGYQTLLSTYTARNALLYQQGNNVLKINMPTLDEPLEITDRFQSASGTLTAKQSPDFQFLGYLNNQRVTSAEGGVSGTLYLLDLLNLDTHSSLPKEGIKVTESVVLDFMFLPRDKSLIYLTTDGELFQCEYRSLRSILLTSRLHSTLLDTNVKGIGEFSGSTLLYYKGEKSNSVSYQQNREDFVGNSFDLYALDIAEKVPSPVLVDSNVYAVHSTNRENNRILYTRRVQSAPLTLFDVWQYSESDEEPRLLLASNIWHIVEANATKGQFLYLSPLQSTLRYEDLYEDNLEVSDRLLALPLSPGGDDEDAPLDDTSEKLAEDVAEQDLEATEEEFTAFEEKQLRDQFRAYIKSNLRDIKGNTFLSFDLYLHQNDSNENLRIGGPIYNWHPKEELVHSDLSNGYAVYTQGNTENITKPKISELSIEEMEVFLSEPFLLLPYLANHLPETLSYSFIYTGETRRIFSETGARFISNIYVNTTTNDFYFTNLPSYQSSTGTLYQVPFQGSNNENVIHIDDDVARIIGLTGSPNNALIYQTESLDTPPLRNIYISTSSGVQEVSTDTSNGVYAVLAGKEKRQFLYFKSFNEQTSSGDLYQYIEEEKFVTNNITGIIDTNTDILFLVRREPNGFRSLYYYNSNELTLMDEKLGGYILFGEN